MIQIKVKMINPKYLTDLLSTSIDLFICIACYYNIVVVHSPSTKKNKTTQQNREVRSMNK